MKILNELFVKKIKLPFILLLCVICLFFLQTESAKPFRISFWQINCNILKILELPFVYIIPKIWKANDELESENLNLKAQIQNLLILARENKELKELLKYELNNAEHIMTSRIIRLSMDTDANIFYIDAILNKEGNYFITNQSGLIGKITDIGKNYAKVELITGMNVKTSVIFSSSGERGILIGDSTSKMRVLYASNSENIQDNELVITSGDGSYYPYGIIVGYVKKGPGKMKVISILDFSKIEFVKVYRKY